MSGSFAFSVGETAEVVLTNGDTKDVNIMTIGGANLTAFVGQHAPYWTDLDDDGTVDDGELNDESIGLAITDVDVGLMIRSSKDLLNPGQYFAGKFTAESLALVGVDNVQAEISHVDVEFNAGAGIFDGIAAVDFKASFPEGDRDGDGDIEPEGYELDTGNSAQPIVLAYDTVNFFAQLAGKLIVVDDSGEQLARLSGAFSLRVVLDDTPSVELFARVDLEIGPPSINLFDMSATGVFFLNEAGIAADLEVTISAGDPSLISFDAEFRLVLNFTEMDQEFNVPPQFIGGGYLTQDFIDELEPTTDLTDGTQSAEVSRHHIRKPDRRAAERRVDSQCRPGVRVERFGRWGCGHRQR